MPATVETPHGVPRGRLYSGSRRVGQSDKVELRTQRLFQPHDSDLRETGEIPIQGEEPFDGMLAAERCAHAEHWKPPGHISFGKESQPLKSFVVPRRIFAVGSDQDVGIDRYQEQSSMRSMRELRASRSAPGCKGPSTVTQESL